MLSLPTESSRISSMDDVIDNNDLDEDVLADNLPRTLKVLLSDKTTGRNIIWASDNYTHRGAEFLPDQEIKAKAITGKNLGVIRPRIDKSQEEKWERTKGMAEVFTPSWVCNRQNNSVDEAWFGRANVFNRPIKSGWRANHSPISFERHGARSWKKYVDNRVIEFACGEAPYIVSRYDTTTGKSIRLERRIGLLDRKLRVVSENAKSKKEWLAWTKRAFKSVYAFEFHGDSLLLARENLFASFADYYRKAFSHFPDEGELFEVANIIAWNVWQMDAITGAVPFHRNDIDAKGFKGRLDAAVSSPLCKIRDWRSNRTIEFRSLVKSGG